MKQAQRLSPQTRWHDNPFGSVVHSDPNGVMHRLGHQRSPLGGVGRDTRIASAKEAAKRSSNPVSAAALWGLSLGQRVFRERRVGEINDVHIEMDDVALGPGTRGARAPDVPHPRDRSERPSQRHSRARADRSRPFEPSRPTLVVREQHDLRGLEDFAPAPPARAIRVLGRCLSIIRKRTPKRASCAASVSPQGQRRPRVRRGVARERRAHPPSLN